jgi:hypothetical protein
MPANSISTPSLPSSSRPSFSIVFRRLPATKTIQTFTDQPLTTLRCFSAGSARFGDVWQRLRLFCGESLI